MGADHACAPRESELLPTVPGVPAERLLPLVYDELRQLAAARLASESHTQTLQPTALVHEAWLRLRQVNRVAWQNRAHFFAAAAEAMRRVLIERARRKGRLKRRGGQRVEVELVDLPDISPDERLLQVDEALGRLEREDAALARVVTLKFYGGLTNQEVADTLTVTTRTVERQWAFARSWLFRELQRMSRE